MQNIFKNKGSFEEIKRIRSMNIKKSIAYVVGGLVSAHSPFWYTTPLFVWFASGNLSNINLLRRNLPTYVSSIDLIEEGDKKELEIKLGLKELVLRTELRNVYSMVKPEQMIDKIESFVNNENELELKLFLGIKDIKLIDGPSYFEYLRNNYIVLNISKSHTDDFIDIPTLADIIFDKQYDK